MAEARHSISAEEVAELAALAAQGLRGSEIAPRLGWSPHKVFQIAAARGITVRRATREELAAAARANFSGARSASCLVPHWVASSLREDYRDLARDHGEDWAARAVRRLMAEMRAAEATP